MKDPGEMSQAEHQYWEGLYEATVELSRALFGWLWALGGMSLCCSECRRFSPRGYGWCGLHNQYPDGLRDADDFCHRWTP